MLIRKVQVRLLQEYAGVLVVRGNDLSSLLKDAEPPRHNRWDADLIENDPDRQKRARTAINKIASQVRETIKAMVVPAGASFVDAEGIGEYLPGDESGEGAGPGDDALRPVIKIASSSKVRKKESTDSERGKKGVGVPVPGDVHNETVHPNPPQPLPKTPVVDPEGGDEDAKRKGVLPGEGSKTIHAPRLIVERAFPVSANAGLYRLIIQPNKDVENASLSILAVGEDGSAEKLNPTKAVIQYANGSNKTVTIQNGKIGPFNLPADSPSKLHATFDLKERFNLQIKLEAR